MKYSEVLSQIRPPDEEAMKLAKKRQAKLAKPPGSLGELEEISIRLAGITGQVENHPEKRRIIVLCADNGIVEEGVSITPRSVTMTQAVNMTKRRTGMSSMAKYFGNDVAVVDVGIHDPYDCKEIIDRKILCGTRNFLNEPAMTKDEVIRAMEAGMEEAIRAKDEGFDVIGIGEMGIGNTSTSSAVLSVLTGFPAEAVTGPGGGMTEEGMKRKLYVIKEGIRRRNPDPADVIDVLSKVGGLDLAAMCGAFLGAAAVQLPVVIDGFISVVAALCAKRIVPESAGYMFPSHASTEPGYMLAMEELGLNPFLLLRMRLGEGSGCPLAFEILAAACASMNGMALFGEEADIDDSYLEPIR